MKTSTLLFSLCIFGMLYSQKTTFKNVRKIYLNSINSFSANDQVKGYYTFYCLDKMQGGKNLYSLNVLDENLNIKSSIEIVRPEDEMVVDICSNGAGFCIILYQTIKDKGEYLFTDLNGKELSSLVTKDPNIEATYSLQSLNYSEDFIRQAGIQKPMWPIEGVGYLRYGMKKSKGRRITIEFFDNNGNKKWDVPDIFPEVEKSLEESTFLCANEKFVITNVSKNEKIFSEANFENVVVCHDVNTGKELYRVTNLTEDKLLQPLGADFNIERNELYIYGNYSLYEKGIKKIHLNEGIFLKIVDATSGKVKMESFSSWKNEISPQLGAAAPKIDEQIYIGLSKMLRMTDESFFLVGSQSSKNSSISNSNLDLFILHFDKNFKLIPEDVYLKNNRTDKYTGYFNYKYTGVSLDKKEPEVIYLITDKISEAKTNYIVGLVSHSDNMKYRDNKMPFMQKDPNFKIMRAKPGYIAVFEYLYKEKTIDFRLEMLKRE